jgi:hypothetical protein
MFILSGYNIYILRMIKRQPINLIPRYIDDPNLIVSPIDDNTVYDDIKIDKNLPQHPGLLYIPGPPSAGKSTVVQWLLAVPYNMFFNKIFIISATIKKDISWQKFKFDETRIYEEYSDAIFKNIVNEIESSEDEKCLIIIDDMTGQDIFSGQHNQLVKFIPVHRHSPKRCPPNICGTSIWILSHQYKTIQKRIRGLMSDLIIFALRSDEELHAIS